MDDNELIARFMGGVFNQNQDNPNKWWFSVQPTRHFRKDAHHLTVGLKYKTEWDWLHPVILKILDLGIAGVIGVAGRALHVCNQPVCQRIEIHYGRVVEFIKWYNQQKNES